MLALTWNDIDFDERTLSVRKTVSVVSEYEYDKIVGKKISETSPKTQKSIRTIPLSSIAIKHLESIKEKNVRFLDTNDHIVLSKTGNMPDKKNIRRTMNAMQEAATTSIQNSGLHTCRHTFASILLNNDVDIKVISDIMGHKSVTTTYNIYAHLMPEKRHGAVNVFDNL